MQEFTKVPNFLFDLDINTYERTILMFIARKTIGWGKESDGISLSQFTKYCRFSKKTVIKSLKSLEEKKLITITKQKDDTGRDCFNLYQITGENIGVQEIHTSVQEIHTGGVGDTHGRVQEIHTQKETNTKETITKEKENKKKSEIVKNYSQDFEDWWIFYKQNTIKVNIDSKKKAFDYYKKAVEIYTLIFLNQQNLRLLIDLVL